jgi:hypothetical protein
VLALASQAVFPEYTSASKSAKTVVKELDKYF